MGQYEHIIYALREQRIKLFTIVSSIALLQSFYMRSLSIEANRSINLCRMWLGKAKGALGAIYPYPHSSDPSNTIIENPGDVGEEDSLEVLAAEGEIVAIKKIRKALKDMEVHIEAGANSLLDNKKYQMCMQQALIHCSEGSMFLGMILGEIKKEEDDGIKTLSPDAIAPMPLVGTDPEEIEKIQKERNTVSEKPEGSIAKYPLTPENCIASDSVKVVDSAADTMKTLKDAAMSIKEELTLEPVLVSAVVEALKENAVVEAMKENPDQIKDMEIHFGLPTQEVKEDVTTQIQEEDARRGTDTPSTEGN